jgi:hypothetical protein
MTRHDPQRSCAREPSDKELGADSPEKEAPEKEPPARVPYPLVPVPFIDAPPANDNWKEGCP